MTIKAQLRRATAHLGYGADAWRVREALYGRAGTWSPAALEELRTRFSAWEQHEQTRASAGQIPASPTLGAPRDAIRASLAEVTRQVDALTADAAGGAP